MAIDILVTKGAVTASLATGYTLSKLLSDIISNYGSTDIRSPGIENWGYRFKYVTNSSKDGFDIYLLTYNSKGRLADTKKYCCFKRNTLPACVESSGYNV